MRVRCSESQYGSFLEDCSAKYLSVLMCNLDGEISSNFRAVTANMCYTSYTGKVVPLACLLKVKVYRAMITQCPQWSV